MIRIALLALAVLLPSVALAEDKSILWKSVDKWVVGVDPTVGNACFVGVAYEDGGFLRLGYAVSDSINEVYMGLTNPAWKSLEAGKDYDVQVKFDDEPAWEMTASAVEGVTTPWLILPAKNDNFLEEFVRKLTLRVMFRGKVIAKLDLRGSGKAVDEMVACQNAMNEASASKAPAPTPSPAPKDPIDPAPAAKSARDLINL